MSVVGYLKTGGRRQGALCMIQFLLLLALGVCCGAYLAKVSASNEYGLCRSFCQMVGSQPFSALGLAMSSYKFFLLLWLCSALPLAFAGVFFLRGLSISYFLTLFFIVGQASNLWFILAVLVFQVLIPFPLFYLYSVWLAATTPSAGERPSSRRTITMAAVLLFVFILLLLLSLLEAVFLNRWLLFYPLT